MFRITKAFENSTVSIYRIEGKITDENLSAWTEEIKTMLDATKHVILDFCQVWYITGQAVEVLTKMNGEGVYLMNCTMDIRNALHVAGLSDQLIG